MKVLMLGPLPPKYHGQSIAFQKATEIPVERVVIDVSVKTGGVVKKVILNLIVFIKIIFYCLKMKREDVVYFTCSRTFSGSIRDVVLLFCARLKKNTVITHLHGSDFKDFYYGSNFFYRKILNYAYKAVDTFVVLSDFMVEQFDMFPNKHVEVVNNFYPSELDEYTDEQKLGISEMTRFVYLSNIMTVKGIFYLLDAFEVAFKRNPKITLNIAGDFVGDDEKNISETKETFLSKIANMKNVNYHGVLTGKKKLDLLIGSDVFVLPTYYKTEAVPLSIFEAMASGCAVITTKHNYLPRLMHEKGAILVDVKGTESLSVALCNYVADKGLLAFHKRKNIEYSRENCSEGVYKSKLEKLINN